MSAVLPKPVTRLRCQRAIHHEFGVGLIVAWHDGEMNVFFPRKGDQLLRSI